VERSSINKLRSLARSAFKVFEALAMLGVLGVAALLGSLWVERRSAITLPAPTGGFAVGRTIYDWTDNAELDALAPAPETKRELLVWIWYPAAGQSDAAVDDYVPVAVATSVEHIRTSIFELLTKDVLKVHGHSLRSAAMSPQQQSYPVLIMRAGASSEVWNYSALAEDLASNGYIVVGLDAPYRTGVVVFPDGRVVRRTPENNPELCEGKIGQARENCANRILTGWTADIAFALDRLAQLNIRDPAGKFTGRLEMTRVGVFGHSFGGAQAAQFCSEDSRCKAGVDVDGALHGSVIQKGIHTPFMFLLSGQGDFSSDVEVRQIKADIQSVYDRLPADGKLQIVIRGANHFLFSDDGALLKSHILMRTLQLLGIVHIDGRRQLAVTAFCLRRFFDAYLKGAGVVPPKPASPLYPEIQALE
jgi:predicted dienelactone hydrolase